MSECDHEGDAETRVNPSTGKTAVWCPRCDSFIDLFDPRYAPGGPLDDPDPAPPGRASRKPPEGSL